MVVPSVWEHLATLSMAVMELSTLFIALGAAKPTVMNEASNTRDGKTIFDLLISWERAI
jgi:hypothetical protein